MKKWISHRYENTTIMGMIKNHPWLGSSILILSLLFLLLIVSTIFQYKNAKTQEAFNKRLQKSLRTIGEQRKQLKIQQEELIRSKAKAEESSRAKTTFLFNLPRKYGKLSSASAHLLSAAYRAPVLAWRLPKTSWS